MGRFGSGERPGRSSPMHNHQDKRDRLRRRIGEDQRRATQLSIMLTLEAQDKDDLDSIEETAALLENALQELEQARRVLVSAE